MSGKGGPMRVLLILLLLQLPAWANMAAPWDEGDVAGEPSATLAEVELVREDLTFDFTPLAQSGPVRVTARYQVRNTGEPHQLELVFVAPGAKNVTVLHQQNEIPFELAPLKEVPPGWQPPDSAPSMDGQTRPVAYHSDERLKGAHFEVPLVAGEQAIEVSYQVSAPVYHPSGQPYREHQFAYILAPARQWKSFGELKLELKMPQGYEYRTTPKLETNNTFDELPADAIVITVARTGKFVDYSTAVVGLAGALAVMLAFVVGSQRRIESMLALLIKGIVAGLAGACLVLFASLGTPLLDQMQLDPTEVSRSFSYSRTFTTLGLGMLGSSLAWLFGTLAYLVANRRLPG